MHGRTADGERFELDRRRRRVHRPKSTATTVTSGHRRAVNSGRTRTVRLLEKRFGLSPERWMDNENGEREAGPVSDPIET
ncbi:hypothetical protein EA472_04585 [Natrarchaeobius oligotrophus]|uniref:Uncharacterized protein n=1 Tax=Natrarchaeobius chitinivorans TaxID=1679083 RepID=A0A3N6N4A9_NATCH|nr:hypothetical protein EA472_04585 [Natrarchaeobius chitinivorans]